MKLEVTLSKRLEQFTLDVAFQSAAPVLGLFGRSGSGKTTLVNCLAGIATPDKGRIAVGDTVLFDSERGINLPPEQRRIGYVFQDALLFPHLNVERNLHYGMRLGQPSDTLIPPHDVIGLLGLERLLARRPATLSGGEKQRVAIGRALLANPRILLMDEPLASLDGERRHEILSYIEMLRDRLPIAIVFVSHSVSEVTRLADDLLLLANGRILACGPVQDIMGRTDLYPHTGRHEGGAILECTILAHDEAYELSRLAFDGGQISMPRIAAPIDEKIRLRIRARDVTLATTRPSGISAANVLEGRLIELAESTGPFIEARIQVGNAFILARITRYSADALGLTLGKTVFALVKAAAIDRRSIGQSSRNELNDE
jgi:molybdate transport system ATP-binding protein